MPVHCMMDMMDMMDIMDMMDMMDIMDMIHCAGFFLIKSCFRAPTDGCFWPWPLWRLWPYKTSGPAPKMISMSNPKLSKLSKLSKLAALGS